MLLWLSVVIRGVFVVTNLLLPKYLRLVPVKNKRLANYVLHPYQMVTVLSLSPNSRGCHGVTRPGLPFSVI